MKPGMKPLKNNPLSVPVLVSNWHLHVCSPASLLCCFCSCAFALLPPPPNTRLQRHVLRNTLLPCLVPLVLLPIIPGNVALLVLQRRLQKSDGHPSRIYSLTILA